MVKESKLNSNVISGFFTSVQNDRVWASQRGRSMVEMLGVLSIIGVLSVGGISAYSTAMKKIKTNDLLAQIRQEAVLIAAQLATGRTNLTLSAENTVFTSVAMVPNTDNFKLTLSGVEEDVCKNVKSMLGSTSMVQSINDNCTEMTFNKNLTPKSATQSGGNSGTESGGNSGGSGENGSAEPADPCADIDCGDHGTCVDGTCECDAGYTGNSCETVLSGCQNEGIWDEKTQSCKCVLGFSGDYCEKCTLDPKTDCPSGELFNEYGETCLCAPLPEGTECSSWETNECGANMYCHFTPQSCNGSTIEAPTKGVCKDVQEYALGVLFDEWFFTYNTELDWWSAQSFCKSLGGRMSSLSDMGCPKEEWGECVSGEGSILHKLYWGYEVCDEVVCWHEYFNPISHGGYWTTDLNGNDNSCEAFVFYWMGDDKFESGIIERYSPYSSVLCRL